MSYDPQEPYRVPPPDPPEVPKEQPPEEPHSVLETVLKALGIMAFLFVAAVALFFGSCLLVTR